MQIVFDNPAGMPMLDSDGEAKLFPGSALAGERFAGYAHGIGVGCYSNHVALDGLLPDSTGRMRPDDTPRLVVPLAHLPEFILALAAHLPLGPLSRLLLQDVLKQEVET